MSFHNPSFYISGTITEIYTDLKQLTETRLKKEERNAFLQSAAKPPQQYLQA